MVAEFGAIRFLFTSAMVGHIESFMAKEKRITCSKQYYYLLSLFDAIIDHHY